MNTRTKDLKGKMFGRWKVIAFSGRNKEGRAMWNCKCLCGNEKVVTAKVLLNGDSKSCGCLKLEGLIERSTKHSGCGTKFYQIWKSLRGRCNTPTDTRYNDYGGRGITYDPRWDDFLNFKKDMYLKYLKAKCKFGEDSHISIERKNVNGNYEKKNCIWIPLREQSKNTRKTKWFMAISPNGRIYMKKNQSEFAKVFGLVQSNISKCLSGERNNCNGWKFNYLEVY